MEDLPVPAGAIDAVDQRLQVERHIVASAPQP
jgi:hypothetical protein